MMDPDSNILCTRLKSFEDAASFKNEWDDLVIRNGSPVYMSYTWCRTWWEYYGAGKELAIFIFRDGSRLIAILPIYIDSISLGILNLRIAKIVGACIPDRVFDPPIEPSISDRVFAILVDVLFKDIKVDLLSFGSLREDYHPRNSLLDCCRSNNSQIGKVISEVNGVFSRFDIPPSFEQYMAGLSKNRRGKLRRENRTLKESGFSMEKINEFRYESDFRIFMEMHARQWNSLGRLGHFHSWPSAGDFHQELSRRMAKEGKLRFFKMSENGIPVAYLYTYNFGKSNFAELSARNIDEKYSWCSMGSHLLIELFNACRKENIDFVEAGAAHYDYKIGLGARKINTFNVIAVSSKWKSRFGSELLFIVRYFIHNVYYRIWYQRIQPRLPVSFRKPILWAWIRTSY